MIFHNQVFIEKNIFNDESIESKRQGKFTEALGSLMINLVKNIIYGSKFKIKDVQNEVYYELEMYILEKMLMKYLKKFDDSKGNGFSLASIMIRNLTYDFLRKLRTRDATGKPKYLYKRNAFTNERDRIINIYIDNKVSLTEIY